MVAPYYYCAEVSTFSHKHSFVRMLSEFLERAMALSICEVVFELLFRSQVHFATLMH